jgi:hypothetical protein
MHETGVRFSGAQAPIRLHPSALVSVPEELALPSSNRDLTTVNRAISLSPCCRSHQTITSSEMGK